MVYPVWPALSASIYASMMCFGVGKSGCPIERWITSFMVEAIFTSRRIPDTGMACMAGFQLAFAFRYFTLRGVFWPASLFADSAMCTSLRRENKGLHAA